MGVMTMMVHIVAGTLGLRAGFVALYAAKGGSVHRKSGRAFVYAMITMALSASIQFAKLIPKPARVPGLLALPLIAILVTMLYWLWRVRIRQSLRGIVGVIERGRAVRPA